VAQPVTKLPDSSCVVKVGEGRGFIIEHRIRVPKTLFPKRLGKRFGARPFFVKNRLVFSAAHCLPKLPPAHAFKDLRDRTYPNLLSSLDGIKNNVWAECLFVDPIADIAVLGCPDNEELDEQADRYHALTDDAATLLIGTARSGPGWVLALNGDWIRTTLRLLSGVDGTSLLVGPTEPGMSGSPILSGAGRAIGIIAIGSQTVRNGERHVDREAGPQPILRRNLPGWLL
jgi:hypothetical protein